MSKAKLKATWACIKVMPHFLSMKKCHKRLMSVRRQSVKLQPQHKMTIYSLTFSSALDTAWNYTKKKNQIVIWIQNMELKKFLIFPGCLWRGQQLSSVDLCIQIRKQRTHPWRDASHFKIFQKKIFLSLLSSGPSFRWQIADFKSLHYANATYILDYILNTVDENENVVLQTWGMIGMIFKRA